MKKINLEIFEKFSIKIKDNIKKNKPISPDFSYSYFWNFQYKEKKHIKYRKWSKSFYSSNIIDKNLFLWENNIIRKIFKKRQMYNIKNLKKQNKYFEKFKN